MIEARSFINEDSSDHVSQQYYLHSFTLLTQPYTT